MQSHAKTQSLSSDTLPFEIHVGDLSHLWDETGRSLTPHHLVVTPTDLHQRNLEEQLRKHQWPHSNFKFRRIGELAIGISIHLQSSVVGNRARRNRVAEADPEFNR